MRLAAIGGTAAALAAVTASPALSSGPVEAVPGTGQAVVTVSTPELPSGRSAAARQRWERLRDRSRGLLEGVAERNDLAIESRIPEIGVLVVGLGPGGLPAVRQELEGERRVEAVRADLPVGFRYQPNDIAFNQPDSHAPAGDYGQWNLLRSGASRAWDLSKGREAEVAVIDTGADGGHPDLAPRIVASAAFGASSPTVDTNGHGTHTAGLACADTDNGVGVSSLGFDCSLFVAKIGGACSDVMGAITAAANRFSDVLSMSFGNCDSAISSALSYALSRGSVLVAAGANEPTPDPGLNYPAQWVQPEGTGPQTGFDRGLVVTSTKYDGTRTAFAQSTTGVSVAAFGSASDAFSGGQQGILSTFPSNITDIETGALLPPRPPCECRTTVGGSDDFAYLVGTSMATPQVAGLAALIRSARPNISAPRISHLIKRTASHCGTYRDGIGWGLIRADEAVEAAIDKDIDPPSSNVKSAKRARRAGVAVAAAARRRIVNLRLKRQDPAGSNCVEKLPASGVKSVAVFASANGGAYHRIGKTKKKRLRFRAKPRRRYRFYSVAVDKAGNREPAPARPDAKLKR